jgi:uncharacterized membrane protein YkvA (DUF1232 family)
MALSKAARMAGKPGRIALLLAKLGAKLKTVKWNEVSLVAAKEKFSILTRITSAYVSGRYRNIPWKAVLIILAAIIYFLNPIDLIPDLIPVVGLTDDFSVLIWVYTAISGEVDKFLAWERSVIVKI